MGGFFGVVSKNDCVMDLYFGVDYHSHLGTRRGGLAVYGEYGFERYIHNIENLCNPGISWSDIAATRFGCRLLPEGFICDVKGSSMFPSGDMRYYLLAFLNSKLAIMYLQMLNPTTTFQVGNISSLPLVVKKADDVANITAHNVELSKADWDSFETSWDFKRNPLV